MATNRKRLREIAVDQYGYVTTADAVALGIPPIELRKLAHRGGLSNVSRGLYRFDDIAPTSLDYFQEAVLWVGKPDACLAGTAVLALHDLAQVNPAALRVNTAHRVRRTQRADIAITHEPIPEDQITTYFAIRSTTVARALSDARPSVMTNRLIDATTEARTEGLINAADYETLMEATEVQA